MRSVMVQARVADARVVVVVRAQKGHGLIGGTGLRAADEDLRAGWVELGATEGDWSAMIS